MLQVDYYGAATSLRQLAGISVPDSSMLVIQPYDKSAMQAIEKAIQMSDLGLTPNNDGKVIRLNIPQLTQVSIVGQESLLDRGYGKAKIFLLQMLGGGDVL